MKALAVAAVWCCLSLPALAGEPGPHPDDLAVLRTLRERYDLTGAMGDWVTDQYGRFRGVTWRAVDGQLRVTGLLLSDFGLEGEFALSGLEYLEKLVLADNDLTSLRLDGLPRLTALDLAGNRLEALEPGFRPGLTVLDVSDNPLQALTPRCFPGLTFLAVNRTPLTELDLGSLPRLEYLYALDTSLAELDTAGNPRLSVLYYGGAEARRLDVTRNPELAVLSLPGAAVTALDLSGCPRLSRLEASGGALAGLDLSRNPLLDYLDVSNSPVSELDLSHNRHLTVLKAWGASFLAGLDLSGQAGLRVLDVSYTGLTSLDLSAAARLRALEVAGTPLGDFSRLALAPAAGSRLIDHLGLDIGQYRVFDFSLTPNLTELIVFDRGGERLEFAANLTLNAVRLKSLELDCEGVAMVDLRPFENLSTFTAVNNRLAALKWPPGRPWTGQAILENNRLPLSQLWPLAGASGRSRLGDQADVFFERLEGRPGDGVFIFDLSFFLSAERRLGEMDTEFSFIEADSGESTSACVLDGRDRAVCDRAGLFRLRMTNQAVTGADGEPVTAVSGVLAAFRPR